MRIFVNTHNFPIGYTTPPFPSIHWPLGALKQQYQELFLYYSSDIWKFTVYWSIIFFAAVYTLVGISASVNIVIKGIRRRRVTKYNRSYAAKSIFVGVLYLITGGAYGLLVGAVIGLLLQAIYRAGLLTMSTWIPFCWGFALILYHICSSYSTSLMLM